MNNNTSQAVAKSDENNQVNPAIDPNRLQNFNREPAARDHRRALPQRLHVCRWCPVCGNEMIFSADSEIAIADNVLSGIMTHCCECNFQWPLTITLSTSNRPFLIEPSKILLDLSETKINIS